MIELFKQGLQVITRSGNTSPETKLLMRVSAIFLNAWKNYQYSSEKIQEYNYPQKSDLYW